MLSRYLLEKTLTALKGYGFTCFVEDQDEESGLPVKLYIADLSDKLFEKLKFSRYMGGIYEVKEERLCSWGEVPTVRFESEILTLCNAAFKSIELNGKTHKNTIMIILNTPEGLNRLNRVSYTLHHAWLREINERKYI